MPQYIMKLHDDKSEKDFYLIWSTIVDAPITYGMSLDEFKDYYKEEYGENGMQVLTERLKRVEETGISAHPPFNNLKEYFGYNRAGENETVLDKEGIIEKFCRQRPVE